jgi:Domain of unknown function (DUF4082)/IPT/TIG domain
MELAKRVVLTFAVLSFSVGAWAQAPAAPGALDAIPDSGIAALWPDSLVPSPLDEAGNWANYSLEVGTRFFSSVNGSVIAIKFYKLPQNTGQHIAHLWNTEGGLNIDLGDCTFANEPASGWTYCFFQNPPAITEGPIYEASVWFTEGYYADVDGTMNSQLDAGPLHALGNGSFPLGNAPYLYAVDAIPTCTGNSDNHGCYGDSFFVSPVVEYSGGLVNPTISGLSASTGMCTGGDQVIITGTGFEPGATVMFGSVPAASVTYMSSTELVAVTPNETGVVGTGC